MSKAISVIIVNFNGKKFLPACLDAIKNQDFKDVEVVVADNGSHDDSCGIVNGVIRDAKVVLNGANIGFPAGMNVGIRNAAGKYVFALNFDCIMEPDFLGKLVHELDIRDDYGSACGKIYRMSEDFEKSNVIDSTGHLMIDRGPDRRGWDVEDTGQYQQAEIVFGAPGNAALYKREMLDDIAFNGEWYDESFFLNLEDIDLDWRANIFGWKCLYLPGAVCHHMTRASYKTVPQKKSRQLAAMYTVNRRLMAIKNDTPTKVVNAFSTMAWKSLRPYKSKDKTWELDFLRFWRNVPLAFRKRKFNNSRRKVSYDEIEYWFKNGSKPLA
jgi:GT2 family glycosyltransferase